MTHTITVRKERPILFTAPMVRAILEDRKTQTRRAINNRDPLSLLTKNAARDGFGPDCVAHPQNGFSPFGYAGNKLWVREAWRADSQIDNIKPSDMSKGEPILYEADTTVITTGCVMLDPGKLRPGIFMMRWMSRITLEITGVRVERLKDITWNDAVAEGMRQISKDGRHYKFGIPDRDGYPGNDDDGWPWNEWDFDPRNAYGRLWESINGAGSWNTNPWVWVIEFKRMEATHG